MKHPPYHLRLNKAVDRLFLLEAIRYLGQLASLTDYTYYGLGGPYLKDFWHLYDRVPEIGLVSIEKHEQTYRRQLAHKPCCNLQLERGDLRDFVAQFESHDGKCIFWLDYTGLEYSQFEDFMALLAKVPEDSMIKITLRAEPRDYIDKQSETIGKRAEDFRRRFGALMPDSTCPPPRSQEAYSRLLVSMLRIAAQHALPSAMPLMFQPISSFVYSDSAPMLTLTGIVCQRESENTVRAAFKNLSFANLDWGEPKRIDLPVLSTKERLRLQELLPCAGNVGTTLSDALGYLIGGNSKESADSLSQYADFHRFYPYFMEAAP